MFKIGVWLWPNCTCWVYQMLEVVLLEIVLAIVCIDMKMHVTRMVCRD